MYHRGNEFGFSWEDSSDETKIHLVSELAAAALAHGMQLRMCSQDTYLTEGVTPARCIDSNRLSEFAGYPIDSTVRGNRPDRGCHASKDVGEYDTCPHGCVYCYAVLNRDVAKERHRKHDPQGEFLFTPQHPLTLEPAEGQRNKSSFYDALLNSRSTNLRSETRQNLMLGGQTDPPTTVHFSLVANHHTTWHYSLSNWV